MSVDEQELDDELLEAVSGGPVILHNMPNQPVTNYTYNQTIYFQS